MFHSFVSRIWIHRLRLQALAYWPQQDRETVKQPLERLEFWGSVPDLERGADVPSMTGTDWNDFSVEASGKLQGKYYKKLLWE